MDHGATVVVVLTGLLSRCRRELVEPERTALLLLAAGCWRPGSLEVWKAGTSILPDNNPDCCMAMRMGNGDVLALLLPRSDGGFPGCSGAATEARHSAATMLLPSLAKVQSSSHCDYESVI